LAIGGPLMAAKGYASPEVEGTYSRAAALCEHLDRSGEERFLVLRGLWNCRLLRGELQQAHDLAERLVALAEEQRAPLRRAHACRALGSTLFFLGRLVDASQQLERGIALADDVEDLDEHTADLLLYTERAGIVCRLYSAWALWYMGFPDRALGMVETALTLGQSLGHANSLAFAQNFASLLCSFRREFEGAQKHAKATIDLAREHQMPEWLAEAIICQGCALVGLGQQMEGLAQLRAGLAAWNDVGAHSRDTQWYGFLAEAHVQAGQFGDAVTTLDRAAETTARTGECHYQSELYRLRGMVLAETGKEGEAASWFHEAIDTARTQQAKSLELRAATSLARLWHDQGRRAEAHDLLAPVYGCFTEGFDTADLTEAKALLDELS
jgi:predicted ATPase